MVVDPWGVAMAGGGDREVTLKTEIDLADLRAAREEFPGLASRVGWLNTPKA